MRSHRFLLLLCALAFSLAAALLRPLPGLAARAAAAKTSEPTPTRRLAASRHSLALGVRVVDFARHFLGVRYVWGGASPGSGFDCSGFVRYVYAHFGVSLPHSSFADFDLGRRIGRWAMRPGDLVFFDGAGHVGIYIGGGRFIHAPHTGTVVSIATLRSGYGGVFDGARRVD